jgi:hypothetical protein
MRLPPTSCREGDVVRTRPSRTRRDYYTFFAALCVTLRFLTPPENSRVSVMTASGRRRLWPTPPVLAAGLLRTATVMLRYALEEDPPTWGASSGRERVEGAAASAWCERSPHEPAKSSSPATNRVRPSNGVERGHYMSTPYVPPAQREPADESEFRGPSRP